MSGECEWKPIMNNPSCNACVRISTDDVPPQQRIDYWLSTSIGTIVGVNCGTLSEAGLHATQLALKVGACGIVDVRGNDHVIERTQPLIRKHAKDSLFLDLLVQGQSFLYQTDECLAASPGDLLLYDADRPYIHGFTSSMRQITFDLPKEQLDRLGLRGPRSGPARIGGAAGLGKMLSRSLLAKVDEITAGAQRSGRIESRQAEEIWPLLEATLQALQPGAGASASRTLTLMRARSHIAEKLSDPELDGTSVARAANVSLRHLQRLFESTGVSLRQFILARRLERCAQALHDPALRTASITEIGYRWGFRDAAHFSRAFKAHFGQSPREFRRGGRC